MLFRLVLMLLIFNICLVDSEAAAPPPIIKVDASTLTPGTLATVANAGSAGGVFNAVTAVGTTNPVVETVDGKKAITFNGSNGLKAGFTAPAGVTGGNPWTVATWIYNPTIGGTNDLYFQWARRPSSGEPNGRAAVLLYAGSSNYAAVSHYNIFDMNYGRLNGSPAAGLWHHIALTYDGAPGVGAGTGTEIIYVDGVAVAVHVAKPLNLFPDTQVLVGCEERSFYAVNTTQSPNQWDKGGLTGSIASIQMFDSALPATEIEALAGGAFLATGEVADPIANNSFENYTYGGRDRNDQFLGGYWTSFTYNGKDVGGTNNQYVRQTKFILPGGSGDHWNNGDNFDGYHVLAMEATAPTKTYANQAVWGLKPNTDYKIWGYFNSRRVNDNFQLLELKMDGVDLLSPGQMRIDTVDPAAGGKVNPFRRIEANWRSSAASSHYLSIGSIGGAKYNGIACDKICIAEVGGPAKPVFSVKDLPKLTSLDFFGVPSGGSSIKSFKLVNDGGRELKITGIATIGAHGYNYTPAFSSNTVAPYGGMVDITVTFAPTAAGEFNAAQLKIDTDSPAASLYLPLTGFSAPQVANGSFEQIYANTGGGDVQASYPGWTTNRMGTGDIGFSYNKNWKWDNGNISDGRQAAVLNKNAKDASESKMSQVIPGFVKGRAYRFRFYANSWRGTTSNAFDGKVMADFRVNGASAKGVKQTGSATATVDFPGTITSREATGVYTKTYDKYEFDWTAPDDGAYPIEFAAIGDAAGDGQNGLLLDNVGVFDLTVAGPATINTTRLDFGSRAINTTTPLNITIYNAGGKDLRVTTATVSGGQAAEFAANTTLPLTVPYAGSANFSVKYMNTSFGQKDSSLTLVCDSGETFIVALTANTTFAAYYPVINNGSLENPTLDKPNADNNNNAPSGWAVPGNNKSGRSAAGAMYNNNGIDPDGGAAVWIRKTATDTTMSLNQDVAGFLAGRTYRVSLYANPSANNGTTLNVNGTAHLTVTVGTTAGANQVNVIDQTTITAVNTVGVFTTPWQKFTGDYTATADGTLRLYVRAGTSSSDDALCFDGVTIQEVAPGIQAAPVSVRFNTVNWFKNEQPTSATITLNNTGLAALNLTGGATGTPGLEIVNANYAVPQFGIVSTTPASKASLAAGESMTVLVRFNPTYKGVYTASSTLRVTSNDPNLPTLDIPLAGDGVPVELSNFSVD